MDTKLESKVDFQCKVCNKYYSSYKSLWNHNRKFHIINIDTSLIKSDNSPKKSDNGLIKSDTIIKSYNCRICSKIYNNKQSRWSHEQKCKSINGKDKDIELEKIKLQVAKEETKILQLKLKLEKSNKIDNITLKQLNKKLLERNNLIKNSTVNSHNNVQNIVNNFQLVGFGKEEVVELLTNKEKKLIMNAKYGCLEKLVETIHCGKYNHFKNIIITNMKDQYMYKYDDGKGQFILSTKNDVLNSLINYRLDDLEVIYNDLIEDNKLDEKTKDIIEKFINKINYSDSKFTDYDGKEHETYKQYKINEIKVLLYNNQDKITNDISLLLTTNEVPLIINNDQIVEEI
jgi:hypothetical protein